MWKTPSRHIMHNRIVNIEFLPGEINSSQHLTLPITSPRSEPLKHNAVDHEAFLLRRKQHDHAQRPSHSFFNSSTVSDDELCSLTQHCCIS